MDWVAGAAAVGSGLVGGVFFVFSVAIMPAFARLPERHGVAVMRTINVTIVRAPFIAVFIGTVLLCVAQVVLAPTDVVGVAGAALYVLGGFGVTVALNVPLNNRLATVDPDAPDGFWSDYARRWTRWNHVRAVACIAAAALLTATA
jgi:uncharacterized membrane protein